MTNNDDDMTTTATVGIDSSTCMTISLQRDQVVVIPNLPPPTVQDSSAIRAITIAIADNFVQLTDAGIQRLEDILTRHDNLEYINIERLTHAVTSISLGALIRILWLPNLAKLTDLRILGANLLGSPDEWQQLAHAILRDHLQSLAFICIVEPLTWLSRIPERALDPLVRVCANHPTLKFVATNLFSGVSLAAIDDFCQSPQIMGLHLVDTDVSGDRVFRFFQQMQSNSKVWFLSIAFAETVSTEHGKAIAQLLCHNRAIANLSVKSKQPLHEDFLVELLQGLAKAQKLEEFSLEGSGDGLVISDSCRARIGTTLEENKVLRKLQLDGIQSDTLGEEIDIFMRLNRAGRRHLLGCDDKTTPTSRQDWMDALGNHNTRNDLNCLYYLLSKNPEVIYCQDQPKQQQEEPLPTKKRKADDISSLD
ncbi:expressed unknown protein [Seminavis robusta]|uniref:Uncharacterized protein n=1 Tax=Seminavis robusta TaxID=568900 RepID=A0A9N8EJI2_9STRA|nr:expressed unknown protein [Seminavis robusta]|eukprot:Sro1307_g261290.1 n/a (422) ;mRNA; f:166-1431